MATYYIYLTNFNKIIVFNYGYSIIAFILVNKHCFYLYESVIPNLVNSHLNIYNTYLN